MSTNSTKSRVAVIKEYFGPWDEPKEFMTQFKKLTDEDKNELAVGAARNMGLTQADVDFDL